MKTRVQLYRPNEGTSQPQLPAPYYNGVSFVLNVVAGFMRMYGISRITLNYSTVGIQPLTDVAFQPLSVAPPEELLKSRNYMVRKLADIMFLFGILDLEAFPEGNDLEDMQKQWAMMAKMPNLQAGQPGQPIPGSTVREIRLNIEDDPTGETVLSNGPITGTIPS